MQVDSLSTHQWTRNHSGENETLWGSHILKTNRLTNDAQHDRPRKTPTDDINTKSPHIVFAYTMLGNTKLMNRIKNSPCGSVVYRFHVNCQIEQWRHNTPQNNTYNAKDTPECNSIPSKLTNEHLSTGAKGKPTVWPYRQDEPANKWCPTWPTEKKHKRQCQHEITANRFCLHNASKHQGNETNKKTLCGFVLYQPYANKQIEQWKHNTPQTTPTNVPSCHLDTTII